MINKIIKRKSHLYYVKTFKVHVWTTCQNSKA